MTTAHTSRIAASHVPFPKKLHQQAQMQTRPPTHTEITNFLESFLPPSLNPATRAREVQYLYHSVRNPSYSPTTQLTSRVVFSITPTPGVYTALSASSPRNKTPVCFLHRPFDLNRRAVRRGALVLACHKSFDEHLTVGWNEALAGRLGLEMESAVCIRGYKGDDERKIGLVARLRKPSGFEELVEKLRIEFAGAGEMHETRKMNEGSTGDSEVNTKVSTTESEKRPISVVAIMNAFHAEEVGRVLAAAHTAKWIDDIGDGSQVLYLTGAARQPGIEALAKVAMPAYCVGHVGCEEWGMRYLAQQTRNRWPGLEVIEVFEEEEPRPTRNAADKGKGKAGGTTANAVRNLQSSSLQ